MAQDFLSEVEALTMSVPKLVSTFLLVRVRFHKFDEVRLGVTNKRSRKFWKLKLSSHCAQPLQFRHAWQGCVSIAQDFLKEVEAPTLVISEASMLSLQFLMMQVKSHKLMRLESEVRFPLQGQEDFQNYKISHIVQIAWRYFECWVLWVIGNVV